MKHTRSLPVLSLAVVITLAATVQSHAASYAATRSSLDAIVGQRSGGAGAPTIGYYEDAAATSGVSTSLVGGTGSTGNRTGQDLIYRYTLPTLSIGETIESYTVFFQITAMRDHGGNDPELDVYLLNTADPTTPGDDSLFFRGNDDTSHDLVGSQLINPTSNASFDVIPNLDVTYTINSGAALATLQGFYGGDHIPDQVEASFRFNLDVGNATDGLGLNRYFVNDSVSTSGFEMTTIPEPSTALLGVFAVLLMLRRRR